MKNSPKNRLEKVLGPVLVIALFTLLLAGCASNKPSSTNTSDTPSQNSSGMEETNPETSENTDDSEYEDGTYTATGNYTSPAGAEQVEVTLTLQDDIITDAEFVGKAQNPTSKMLQGKFAEGFKELVVGKPIDELSLTVVNGSSLAPKGFMDAVANIKEQAEA